MKPISFTRHQFPPDIIRHAVWLYGRFTLLFRDVEGMLEGRGIEVSNETVRRWFLISEVQCAGSPGLCLLQERTNQGATVDER